MDMSIGKNLEFQSDSNLHYDASLYISPGVAKTITLKNVSITIGTQLYFQ